MKFEVWHVHDAEKVTMSDEKRIYDTFLYTVDASYVLFNGKSGLLKTIWIKINDQNIYCYNPIRDDHYKEWNVWNHAIVSFINFNDINQVRIVLEIRG